MIIYRKLTTPIVQCRMQQKPKGRRSCGIEEGRFPAFGVDLILITADGNTIRGNTGHAVGQFINDYTSFE